MNRRLSLLPVACGAILLLAYLAPVLGGIRTRVLGPFGGVDAVLQAGILEWTGRHFWQPAVWLHLPIFYPAPYGLAFMDSLLGQAVLVLPLRVLGGGPGLLYNLAWTGTLVLAGLGFLSLWLAGGGRWPGGAFGALVLLGSPYTLAHAGHLNQLPPPPLLFSLAALVAAMRGLQAADDAPSRPGQAPTVRDQLPSPRAALWAWSALLVLQAAWGWYGLLEAVVGGAALLGGGIWWSYGRGGGARSAARLLRRIAPPALVAAMGISVLSVPYLLASRHYADFQRSQGEVRAFSADLVHFLNSGAYRLERQLLGRRGAVAQPGAPVVGPGAGVDRQVLHPGWIGLGMAVAGWVLRRRLRPWRRRATGTLLAAGIAGLVLAFGDSVGLPGTERRLLLPMGLLQSVLPPLRAFRAVWRLSFLMVIAVSWLAALAWELGLAHEGPSRRRSALAAGICALLLLESWPLGLPAVGLPVVAPVAAAAGGAPGRGRESGPAGRAKPAATLTLPAPAVEAQEDLLEASWLFRALADGCPVTGGVSGWVPPFTRRLRRELAACERGEEAPAELLAELKCLGVRRAMVAIGAGGTRARYWQETLTGLGYQVEAAGQGLLVFRLGDGPDTERQAAARRRP
jgi:hypothetical protein